MEDQMSLGFSPEYTVTTGSPYIDLGAPLLPAWGSFAFDYSGLTELRADNYEMDDRLEWVEEAIDEHSEALNVIANEYHIENIHYWMRVLINRYDVIMREDGPIRSLESILPSATSRLSFTKESD